MCCFVGYWVGGWILFLLVGVYDSGFGVFLGVFRGFWVGLSGDFGCFPGVLGCPDLEFGVW